MQNDNPSLRIIRKDISRPYDTYEKMFDTSNDWRHGHLEKVEHYKQNSLVSSVSYSYNIEAREEQWYPIGIYKPYRSVEYIVSPDREYNYLNSNSFPVENSTYVNGSWRMDVHEWKTLKSETHRQYFYRSGNKETIETVKNYDYTDYRHIHPTVVTTANNAQAIEDKYSYKENMVNVLSSHKRTVNGDSIVSIIDFSGNRPAKVRQKIGNRNAFDDKIIYDKYDAYGNIAEISTNDGKHTCYIWSYNNQHPVAEVDNITYPNLLQALGKSETWIRELGNKYQPSEQDMNLLNNLRNQLGASHVSTFTYKPLLGVSSITDASGFTTHYGYDNFGRLTETSILENGQKKALQTNEYHINEKVEMIGSGFIITGTNIEPLTILENGKPFVFKVYVLGGSGNFDYEWDLFWGEEWPSPNYHEIHYVSFWSKNEITMIPDKTNSNINRLKIWVTDKASDEVKEFQTWFYVQ